MSAPALHPLHRAWRVLPAGTRRRLLSRGAALLAPRPDRHPPPWPAGLPASVVVAGELGRASGLGEGARVMLRALEGLGVAGHPLEAGLLAAGEGRGADGALAVAPRVAGGRARSGARADGSGEVPAGAPLVLHVNAPVLPAALLRLPRGLLRGRRVVGYWAWELPTLPPGWAEGARFVHEVWAPSRFTARALEPLLPGRVRVVPHALAAAPPVPSALDRAGFGLPAGALVTLCSFSLASSFERKNPLAAIAAHRLAFGDRADRVLVLKVAHAAHHGADLERLRAAVAGAGNVRVEERTLPAADSHALTACADVVLSLHRSEGFGLVPAEAMLLGRAVVATDWSATAEFLDAGCGMPVPCRLVPARDPRGVFEAPGAVWAEADVPAAADALRRLEDPALRAALGDAARAAATARLGAGPLAAALRGAGMAAAGAGDARSDGAASLDAFPLGASESGASPSGASPSGASQSGASPSGAAMATRAVPRPALGPIPRSTLRPGAIPGGGR